ncbi:MAG TPA: adenylyl-sulfate kinase [Parapedobacter sp.]|uniref:adenylyl-sulfate kinase n=1 Tax=Parapedobacter sp. TaxID=1958893 RepID=UPI002BAA60E1|nr:adenylyl-sulfate kinase [Parapedobacter sp.]HWK56623.1 adenylyl-sulfate kinase [Parapedobacter sp.]
MKNIVQFTGLSGVGKTTLAVLAGDWLAVRGYNVAVLDGDELRKTLSADLGFSKADRLEHLRRLACLANETDADIVLLAVINPYQAGRSYFREICGAHLVWLKCALDVLRERDTKGLYARASLPEGHPDRLTNLTGVSDPYEEPIDADLVIDTGTDTLENSATKLVTYLMSVLDDTLAIRELTETLPT